MSSVMESFVSDVFFVFEVLFKYETVYPMKSRWCLNWHRVGMMLVLGGACMAIGSMSLLPITMGSAGSALPIVFG